MSLDKSKRQRRLIIKIKVYFERQTGKETDRERQIYRERHR